MLGKVCLSVARRGNSRRAGRAGSLGQKVGVRKLSERVDRIEQIILDTRERLAQSESQGGRLSQKMLEIEDQVLGQQWVWKTTDSCERDRTVHLQGLSPDWTCSFRINVWV